MIGGILGAGIGILQYILMHKAVTCFLEGTSPGKAVGFYLLKLALLVGLLVGCLCISREDLIAAAVTVCGVYIGLAAAKLLKNRLGRERGDRDGR